MELIIANLIGSEKQVVWATDIRKPIIAFLESTVLKLNTQPIVPGKEALKAKVESAIQQIAGVSSAAKWIEFQPYSSAPGQLLNNIISGRVTMQ